MLCLMCLLDGCACALVPDNNLGIRPKQIEKRQQSFLVKADLKMKIMTVITNVQNSRDNKATEGILWIVQDMQLASCVPHAGTGKMNADEQRAQLIPGAFCSLLAEPFGSKANQGTAVYMREFLFQCHAHARPLIKPGQHVQ